MNKQIVVAMVALLAVTVSVSADSIFVENFSFELPGTVKQGFDNVPAWTGVGAGGGGVELDWGPTDGLWTGYSGWDMEVYNLTDHTILANGEYTLTLDARKTWQGPNITIELYYDNAGARVSMGSLFHEFPGGDTTDMEELTLTVLSNDTPASMGKKIGIEITSGNAGWIGYDSVRVDEVVLGPILSASGPSPSDLATDVCADTLLMWIAGESAVSHDVYLGTSFDDVNDATTADPRGVYRGQVTVAQFDISTVLTTEFATTYYWRIDENDGPPTNAQHKGLVWSFTIEPLGRPIDGSAITATASSTDPAGGGPETTVDGSGLDVDGLHGIAEATMWRSANGGDQPTWIEYDLGQIYSLAQACVWNYNGLGLNSVFGMMEVTVEYLVDGATWTELAGVADFAKAPGAAGYAADSTINFDGAEAQYVRITAVSNYAGGLANQFGISEILFSFVAVGARAFSPEDGAADVYPEADLNWVPGRGVITHNVYFSTDRDLVADRTALAVSIPVGDTCQQGHDPGPLLLGQTYYWAVDQVNNDGTSFGQVLEFTVVDSLVIDDMEAYGDAETPGEVGGSPWYVWKDGLGWTEPEPGYSGNDTGSIVGNANPPYPERTIVTEGRQSLPYFYDNTGGKAVYSEATAAIADLPIGPDFSRAGGKVIRLWFHGAAANSATVNDQMYIKINGVKVVYDGPVTDLQSESWQVWNIDLAEFAGVNLSNVTEISLGFGENNGVAGGTGVVYFDAITLNPSICILSERSAAFAEIDYVEDCVIDALELEVLTGDWLSQDSILPTETAPTTDLVGWYKFDEGFGTTTQDSSGNNNHGTLIGAPVWMAGHIGAGSLQFDGEDYVEVPHDETLTVDTEVTVMAWINAKRHTGPGGAEWQGILAKGDSTRSYSLYTTGGGVLHFSTAGVGTTSTTTVTLNEWVHVVAMVVNGGHRYYINGELAGEGGGGIVLPGAADTDSVRIGMTNEGGNGFLGMIDEVRIYRAALSAPQVAGLADSTPGDDELHVPVSSPAELYDAEPQGEQKIDFRDFAVLMDYWAQDQLWP
ncbi:MAG: discoidin domain-containing protein [Planctomycetes bacterium]|nr:discoidin domain-containing protein [Planctomycetota bacterium]